MLSARGNANTKRSLRHPLCLEIPMNDVAKFDPWLNTDDFAGP